MVPKQYGFLSLLVISYGLPNAMGEVEVVPEVPDICGELLERFETVMSAIKDNNCDDAHEDAWRTHEECFEFGGEIPRCMKGAKNLAEVEECLFEGDESAESVLHSCKCMGLIDAELKIEDVIPYWCPAERGQKNLNLSDDEQLIFLWYLLGLGEYGLQFGQRHFQTCDLSANGADVRESSYLSAISANFMNCQLQFNQNISIIFCSILGQKLSTFLHF